MLAPSLNVVVVPISFAVVIATTIVTVAFAPAATIAPTAAAATGSGDFGHDVGGLRASGERLGSAPDVDEAAALLGGVQKSTGLLKDRQGLHLAVAGDWRRGRGVLWQGLGPTLSTATQEQRNTVREQLKANRDKFLTDTQQVRTEIRDQLKDLGVSVRENKPTDGGGSGGGKGPGRPRG